MAREFVLPDLGEGVREGTILRLLVREGEFVREDQLLMEVETDKAAVEIPSPYEGTVARWHVAEQEVVNVGDVMVTFDGEAGAGNTTAAPARTAKRAATGATATTSAAVTAPTRRPPASPAVRKLARTRGIDLATVTGSGPGGRILRADLDRSPAAATAPEPRVVASPVPPPATGTLGTDPGGPVSREPIGNTRRAIASVMSRAIATIPHVTDCDDADVTELDRVRRGYNAQLPKPQQLGLLPFVVRAVARALVMHPAINASWDEEREEIVFKRYYHIAIGVQTERGLVAPVLRHADRKGVREIADQLTALAERARAGTLGLEESRGATYTISNAGAMGGSRYSTPIITPPQAAVLAIGRSRRQPWVVGDAIEPRLIMPLSHSMDHRLIDGAIEIAFMRQVIGDLEHPGRLLIDPPPAPGSG